MKQTLLQFTDSGTTLYAAAGNLFERLGITFSNRITERPVDIAAYYRQAQGSLPKSVEEAFSHVTATYIIGTVDMSNSPAFCLDNGTDGDNSRYRGLLFFAVDIDDDTRLTRTRAAVLTRALNRLSLCNPVMLLIRQGTSIAVALCERTAYIQQQRRGEKPGRVRIMMNINCREPHRGHLDMLQLLAQQCRGYDELYSHWLHVFSVQTLTRRFYGELQDWYFRAVRLAKFPNDINRDDDCQAHNAEALIRLITRFIFVWFLKHKGLVNDELFRADKLRDILKDFDPLADDDGRYYNAVIQNLFFATLNRKIDERKFIESYNGMSRQYDVKTFYRCRRLFNDNLDDEDIKALFSRTPYVNGSLFECLDNRPAKDSQGQDITLSLDGFSNTHADRNGVIKQAFIPNSLFFATDDSAPGLINILSKYHFTIEENTPTDEQIALDPELLGRVFENLLGAFNPETQETARKESGSFYTPREIVDYMATESIIACLTQQCDNITADDVRALLDDNDDCLPDSIKDNATTLMQTIFNCRILDPACGSGAFPMGLLQRLVIALRKLDPDNSEWEKIIRQQAVDDTAAAYNVGDKEEREARLRSISDSFTRQKDNPDYARKLYLIERCIHGVDLQPIAIQISKLRFFISLLCEQQTDDNPKDNYGILTLPNLETNLVAADSLIALKENSGQLEGPDVKRLKVELTQVRHRLFYVNSASEKKRLRSKDKQLRKQLAEALEGSYASQQAEQMAAWDPYDQNTSAPFFDPQWMFGISTGFNIVIGNPPYIQLSNNGGRLGRMYEHCKYKTFSRSSDIYCLFYERALQLCAPEAYTMFITSNKWMRAGYGQSTRAFLADNNPRLLIDFGGLQVFESATVDTNILLVQKAKNSEHTLCATVNSARNLKNFKLDDFAHCNLQSQTFNNEDAWTILSPVEQSIKAKIEQAGTPLKDWDVQIYRGVLTGFNPAFIINTDTRNRILSRCLSDDERQRTEKLIRKVLRGRDIKRYGYQWADLWLINTHNGVRNAGIPRIDINDYPAVKEHLDSFGNKLAKRQDQGDTPYNLRNCAYLQDFDKPKIFWKAVGRNLTFCIAEAGVYLTAPASFIRADEYNEYILGVLHSSIAQWFIYTFADRTGAGDIMLNIQSLVRLPIPRATAEQQQPIVDLVRQVLAAKAAGEDTAALEREIDLLVCDLYGLTDDERATIGFVEIT